MNSITKHPKQFDAAAQILAYWLMFCRAPGRKTLPGEPIDLGEVGIVRLNDQRLQRDLPYSICTGIRGE